MKDDELLVDVWLATTIDLIYGTEQRGRTFEQVCMFGSRSKSTMILITEVIHNGN